MGSKTMASPLREGDGETAVLRAVARAKQGDPHAVRALYARYAPAVRLYAASLLRDADAVDDVVQTTFLKLLTRIDRYEPQDGAPFEAWLLRVARNAAYDELRRRKVRAGVPVMDHDGAEPSGPESLGDLPEALSRMPAAWREVLVLRHVVGLTVQETADRLGTTARTVGLLHDRGRASLRASLRGAPARRPAAAARPRRRAVVEQLA